MPVGGRSAPVAVQHVCENPRAIESEADSLERACADEAGCLADEEGAIAAAFEVGGCLRPDDLARFRPQGVAEAETVRSQARFLAFERFAGTLARRPNCYL